MTKVSVIVPCYNEENTILLLLHSIYAQTYPHNLIEVIIADGGSVDKTRANIHLFTSEHSDLEVKLVNNKKKIIPAGLNLALKESKGEIIIRLDAHSKPDRNYITDAVELLKLGLADNVGGVWDIQPFETNEKKSTWIARGIAAAASSPIGVGDARYRYAQKMEEVDTVPFGAFRRDLIEKVGFFNEDLLTNEDYEFNYRIRLAGGKILLDPKLRSVYFARPNITKLIQQYWRYGYWKVKMLKLFPESIRWRQALPPLFVLSIIFMMIFSIISNQIRFLLFTEVSIYIFVLILVGFWNAVKRKDILLIISMPIAFVSMHISWGLAFLWSSIQVLFQE